MRGLKERDVKIRALTDRVTRLEQAEQSAQAERLRSVAVLQEGENRKRDQEKRISDLEQKTKMPEPRLECGPANKGMTVTSADKKYQMRWGLRLQPAFVGQHLDTLGLPAQGFTDKESFQMRRLRVYSDGYLGKKERMYRLQFDAAVATGILRDAFIEESFEPELKVRFGQFKAPFGRQFITSALNLLFVDRSIAAQMFANQNPGTLSDPRDFTSLPLLGVGRELGLQVWGDVGGNAGAGKETRPMVRYFASVNNGSGQNAANEANAGSSLEQVYRLEIHPLGDYGAYSEGAQDMARKPLVVLDGGYVRDDNNRVFDTDGNGALNRNDRQDREMVCLAAALRWRRFHAQAESFRQWTTPKGVVLGPPVAGIRSLMPLVSIGSAGWYYQISYILKPHRLELAWRDSTVDPSRGLSAADLHEKGGALDYYIEGHPTKLTLDVMRLTDDATPTSDQTRARFQYQLSL